MPKNDPASAVRLPRLIASALLAGAGLALSYAALPAAVQHPVAIATPVAGAPTGIIAHPAAIASAHPLATRAGQEILAAGGNAFDAAVAVSAALAVVEPCCSGLSGGGFYLLHRDADHLDTVIDAREKAPGSASRDMYLDSAGKPIPHASTGGPLAAGIPGEPAAFEYLARKFGKLSLKQSLQPAIRLAREGFPLDERIHGVIGFKRDVLLRSPDAAHVWLTPSGAVPDAGTIIKQPELAATLEALANDGARGFYTGHVAQDLVAGVRAGGGIWTLADLAAYKVVERKPIIGTYRGARIVSASPPASGGVVLMDELNILSGFDLQKADPAMRKHLVIEA